MICLLFLLIVRLLKKLPQVTRARKIISIRQLWKYLKTKVHLIDNNIAEELDPNTLSTHKLRNTAATLMHKYEKVDIRPLQEILDHESIATTEIYTHMMNTSYSLQLIQIHLQ